MTDDKKGEEKELKRFRMSLKVKDCNMVFKEGFEPGVLVTQEVAYPPDAAIDDVAISISTYMDQMIKDNITVDLDVVDPVELREWRS